MKAEVFARDLPLFICQAGQHSKLQVPELVSYYTAAFFDLFFFRSFAHLERNFIKGGETSSDSV